MGFMNIYVYVDWQEHGGKVRYTVKGWLNWYQHQQEDFSEEEFPLKWKMQVGWLKAKAFWYAI